MNSESGWGLKRLSPTLVGPLADFWHWWTGELAGLIPAHWRRRFEGRERRLRFMADGFELLEGEHRYRIPLEQCATDPTLSTWRTLGKTASRLVVVLPRQELLHKSVLLPMATESRLQAVLGFELDRHTPFSAEQASFGYRVVRRDRTAQKIEVELFVLPNVKRERILEALSQAGLTVDRLLPEGFEREAHASAALNLLPDRQRPQVRRTLRSRPIWILLILVLLIGILFQQREKRLQALELAIGPKEQAAEAARAVRSEIDALEAGGQYILERRQATPARLVLLEELTRLLPDHTWLQRFELQGKELRIQGESSSASSLIALLEESPLLHQVSFISPVTINPRSRKERFSLTAQLRAPSAAEVQP